MLNTPQHDQGGVLPSVKSRWLTSRHRWPHLQNFGFKDGIPGTEYHRLVQARKQMEALVPAKIKPAIDNADTLAGERSAVIRLYQSYKEEELKAGAVKSAGECALKPRHLPLAAFTYDSCFVCQGRGQLAPMAMIKLQKHVHAHTAQQSSASLLSASVATGVCCSCFASRCCRPETLAAAV